MPSARRLSHRPHRRPASNRSNGNYKREAIDGERWRTWSGWAVGGGRMAAVSESTSPSPSSTSTVSIGLAGSVGPRVHSGLVLLRGGRAAAAATRRPGARSSEPGGSRWTPCPKPPDWRFPEADAYAAELRRLVLEAIDELPPTFREVVRLRDVEERSNAEVAEWLHISKRNAAGQAAPGAQTPARPAPGPLLTVTT